MVHFCIAASDDTVLIDQDAVIVGFIDVKVMKSTVSWWSIGEVTPFRLVKHRGQHGNALQPELDVTFCWKTLSNRNPKRICVFGCVNDMSTGKINY